MSVITIHSNIRDYRVDFGSAAGYLSKTIRNRQPSFFIVDNAVWKLYKDSVLKCLPRCDVMVLSIGEDKKILDSVLRIYDALIARSAKRNMTMVTIGGGIAQDISGFAASTLYRGIEWIFLPTTLLAQCDSCIGGKTSLNYKRFKNIVGTFYPPIEVFIDISFLTTQKKIDYFSGLGEVVKLDIMGGEKATRGLIECLPEMIKRDNKVMAVMIKKTLAIKKSYIERDEFDSGLRNLLNYGHCFGHAIESVSRFEIPHGQAVVAGMMLANIISYRRGIMSQKFHTFVMDELLRPALVVKVKAGYLQADAIIGAMRNDKKRVGDKLSVVMLRDGYKLVKVNDAGFDEVSAALADFVFE
jgi:3-dehydroquinate synthase